MSKKRRIDAGRDAADKMLGDLEGQLKGVYTTAYKEMETKVNKYLSNFKTADEHQQKMVADGKITQADYTKWRQGTLMTGNRWEKMRDEIANDLSKVNETAKRLTGDMTKDVFAESHNYAVYAMQKQSGIDPDKILVNTGGSDGKIVRSFNIYNKQAVERLVAKNPDILPQPGKKVSKAISEGRMKRWDKKQIQSVMAQGIIQGESIPNIAKRLAKTVGETNMNAAVRNARTMTTAAENAGRDEAYREAEDMGIKVKRRWVATLDDRTRHEHAMLDGQERGVDEPFEVNGYEIMYPGDPSAAPEMVYNCRCAVISIVVDTGNFPRASKLGDMSYDEWKEKHRTAIEGG